jgi:hypothetical protein
MADPTTKKWFIESCKDNLSLPPNEEMGKIWLEKYFPYNECIHNWFYEATDVTHVTSDISNYEDLLSSRTIERVQHNELLYALQYAPYLSTKWTTHGVLEALENNLTLGTEWLYWLPSVKTPNQSLRLERRGPQMT